MVPTDVTKNHVITRYVAPARIRGEKTIEVRVGNVLKELGWTNRTPSVFSTLSSQSFQKEAGLELIEKRGGPPSGGPSTTVQFVYRILDNRVPDVSGTKTGTIRPRFESLFGICADVFRKFGGGEAYLKAERDWAPDPWEKLATQDEAQPGKGETR